MTARKKPTVYIRELCFAHLCLKSWEDASHDFGVVFVEAWPVWNTPVMLLKLFSEDDRRLDKLLDLFNLYSQIVSDYLNLTSVAVSHQ